MRSLFTCALLVASVACMKSLHDVAGTPTTATSYSLGQAQTASIGDPIFDVQTAELVPVFVVATDFVPDFRDLPPLRTGMVFVAVGSLDDGSLVVMNPDYSTAYGISVGLDGNVIGGIVNMSTLYEYEADADWPRPLFTLEQLFEGQEGAFRAQIVYGGLTGTTVKADYREFVGDLIRPAFSQQLQYDLASDSVIAYKTIRARVLSATNTEITFVITEDGGLPWLPSGSAPPRR